MAGPVTPVKTLPISRSRDRSEMIGSIYMANLLKYLSLGQRQRQLNSVVISSSSEPGSFHWMHRTYRQLVHKHSMLIDTTTRSYVCVRRYRHVSTLQTRANKKTTNDAKARPERNKNSTQKVQRHAPTRNRNNKVRAKGRTNTIVMRSGNKRREHHKTPMNEGYDLLRWSFSQNDYWLFAIGIHLPREPSGSVPCPQNLLDV